jgi:hypothetical protein
MKWTATRLLPEFGRLDEWATAAMWKSTRPAERKTGPGPGGAEMINSASAGCICGRPWRYKFKK